MAKKPETNASNWKYNPRVFDTHPWHKRKPVSWDMLTIHCSATPPDMDIGVDQMDYWHRQRGFEGVGYNYIIRRDGTIEGARPTTIPGAHATGYNRNSLSVCLVGGVKRIPDRDGKNDADGPRWDLMPEDNFTPAQYGALHTLVMQLVTDHGLKDVVGHRDLPEVHKDCPCFDVGDWVRTHADLVALIADNQ